MPDTFSMSLVIMALYFGSNYLSKTKEKAYVHLLFSFLLLMLGTLSKLPSGYILACVPLLLAQPAALRKKIVFSVVTVLGFIPCLVWYFYWVPYLVETYDFWHFFMGKSISQGWSEVVNDIPQAMSRFYEIAIKVLGFLVFCFGLGYAVFKKEKNVTLTFILAFASFLVIMIKAGDTFLHHDYYIIPFVPVMALIAGYGLHQVASRHQVWGIILLSGIMLEGVINQYQDFIVKPEYGSIENLANDLDKVSDKADLIVINSGQYPTPMYFANRKGWIATNDQLSSNLYIDSLTSLGLKKIVVLKVAFGEEIKLPEKALVFENDSYLIYDVLPSY